MTDHFYLESSTGQTELPRRIELEAFPVTFGRHPDCIVQLNVDRISRQHARIEQSATGLRIEDLGSTNGTFVNHQPIDSPTPIVAGDVVHLADHEFRLMRDRQPRGAMDRDVSSAETVVGMEALPSNFPLLMGAFFELLENQQVAAYRQPIVTPDGSVFGWELLGRSLHPELTEGPDQLFGLARALGAEVRLSRLLRRQSFEAASRMGVTQPFFFNNHPAECEDFDGLLSELKDLRAHFPDLGLVFEVHEAAVTDLDQMAEVRRELAGMDIALAYDDFGAGQARLLELIEVPPDYLKFDIALVRGLETRESAKYRLLSTLHDLISGMGIQTLAEGVEDAHCADLCIEIGIDLMQGFHFAWPEPFTPLPPQRG